MKVSLRSYAYGHRRPYRHYRPRRYTPLYYGAPAYYQPSYYGPTYGTAVSVWLDGIGFSYYEPGYGYERHQGLNDVSIKFLMLLRCKYEGPAFCRPFTIKL